METNNENAKPIDIKYPILATFLVATPRSGTYAMSEIFHTKYCYAHHEGCDFKFAYINGNRQEELPYENSYSYQMLMSSMASGKHYFCCDQSCSLDLFIAACKSNTIKDLIHDGKLQLQIIRMDREPVAAAFSLTNKVKAVGYRADPKMYLEQLIQSQEDRAMLVQANRDIIEECVGERIYAINYENVVDENTGLFVYPFIAQTALITGAAGSMLGEDENASSMTQIRIDNDPDKDYEVMCDIAIKAFKNLDVPNDTFKRNVEAIQEIYKPVYDKMNREAEASLRREEERNEARMLVGFESPVRGDSSVN